MLLAKDVDPQALRRCREAYGMTHAQLADIVGASPLEVAAWEDGGVRVPRKQARRLRQLDTAAQREAAIAAAALPGCPWADAHAPGLHGLTPCRSTCKVRGCRGRRSLVRRKLGPHAGLHLRALRRSQSRERLLVDAFDLVRVCGLHQVVVAGDRGAVGVDRSAAGRRRPRRARRGRWGQARAAGRGRRGAVP